jgi:O-antigen/teichoic acid export membrane protein
MSNIAGLPSAESAEEFIRERTRLHELYIREQERTKRIGLVLAAVLILAASALVLFAPTGRETLSYWIGAALVIFAAGAMGYKRVWGKSKNITFGADQDDRDLPA